jgi:hypothetical protein
VRCTGLLVLHALLLCAACAPVSKLPQLPADEIKAEQRKQQIAQLRSYLGQLSRLDNVAFQLRVANRDDCEDRASAQIGLIAGTVPSLPRKFRSFSHEALAVSGHMQRFSRLRTIHRLRSRASKSATSF